MRLFGLIGYPIEHSFSAAFFSEKFEKELINDCAYQNLPLSSIRQFPSLISTHPELCGLNVTVPYKELIIPYLNALDNVAAEIGAVNCINVQGKQLTGFNTDAFGFEYSIKPFLENKYERALILGSGGASKAIIYTLKKWGIDYRVATRTPKMQYHLSYEDITPELLSFFPLIINTTPLGTFPDTANCPNIPYEAITEQHFLYDLVYNPSLTTFLKRGRDAGAQVMNGLAMLKLQAEKSWEIWNKHEN